MSLVEWSDDLSVQVVEIDEQHKKLVEMLNDLHEAMRAGRARDKLGEILDGLIQYAEYHFSTEEEYFDRLEYPDAEAHKREHRDFVKQVSEFKAGFDRGSVLLSVTVMNFLVDWAKYHIQGIDRSFGPSLNEHGRA
jgi:hemerythrin